MEHIINTISNLNRKRKKLFFSIAGAVFFSFSIVLLTTPNDDLTSMSKNIISSLMEIAINILH